MGFWGGFDEMQIYNGINSSEVLSKPDPHFINYVTKLDRRTLDRQKYDKTLPRAR